MITEQTTKNAIEQLTKLLRDYSDNKEVEGVSLQVVKGSEPTFIFQILLKQKEVVALE